MLAHAPAAGPICRKDDRWAAFRQQGLALAGDAPVLYIGVVRPTFVCPLVPADAARPPRGHDWLHEPKWDGFRFQVIKNGDRLHSKSGAEYTDRLPNTVDAFKSMPTRSAVLDGELCLTGADGLPRFYDLFQTMRSRWPDADQLMFLAFALLHQDGVDLRHLPLSERKRDLDRLCGRSKVRVLRMSNTFPTVPCCLSTAPIMALKASCRNASIARMSTGHARCGRRR